MKRFTTSLCTLLLGTAALYAQKTDVYLEVSANELPQYTADGVTYVSLGNLIKNPTFSLDPKLHDSNFPQWTEGDYNTPMGSSYFTWHSHGGYDNGAWIESTKIGGPASNSSIATRWTLLPNTKYYLRFWTKNLTSENQSIPVVSLTNELSTAGGQNEYGTTGKTLLGKNANDTSDTSFGLANASADGSWTYTAIVFDSENYTNLQFRASDLDKVGFDGFYLSKLIPMEDAEVEATPEDFYNLQKSVIYQDICKYDSIGFTSISRNAAEMLESEENSYEAKKDDMEKLLEEWSRYVEGMTNYEDFGLGDFAEMVKTTEGMLQEVMQKQPNIAGVDNLKKRLEELKAFVEEGYSADKTVMEDYYSNKLPQISNEVLTSLRTIDKLLDEPIDMTNWIVNAPNFTSAVAKPTITYKENNGGIESISYPYASLYTDEDSPYDYEHTEVGDWSNAYRSSVYWYNDRIALRTDETESVIRSMVAPGYYTLSAEVAVPEGSDAQPRLYFSDDDVHLSETVEKADGSWEYLTTTKVYAPTNRLEMGVRDEDGESFYVTNFRLLYYGNEAEKMKEATEQYKERMIEQVKDMTMFKGDKKDLLDSIQVANEQLAENQNMLGYAEYLDKLVDIMYAAMANKTSYRSYGSYIDDIKTACGQNENALAVADALAKQMNEVIDADDLRYNDIKDKDYFKALIKYRKEYFPVLNKIEALSLNDSKANDYRKEAFQQEISTLNAEAMAQSEEEVMNKVENVEKQYAIILGQEDYASGSNDLTARICNPSFDARHIDSPWRVKNTGASGWTVSNNGNTYSRVSNEDCINENLTYDERYYYETEGSEPYAFTIKQTLSNIPNGVYTLTAKMRTSGDGYYLVASEKDDLSNATLAAAHVQKTDMWYIDPENHQKGQDFVEVGNAYGPIWTDAKDQLANNPDNKDLQGIVNANDGKGNGWFPLSLTIEVKNHELTIGATTDSLLTLGNYDTDGNATVAFKGTFASIDDLTLTLDKDYDNGSWSITGIEKAATNANALNAANAIYDLNGRRVNQLSTANKGIYIVKKNGQTLKVLKK